MCCYCWYFCCWRVRNQNQAQKKVNEIVAPGRGGKLGTKNNQKKTSPTPEGHLLEAIAHGLDHSTDTRASGGTGNRGRFLGRWPSIGMHPSVRRLRCLAGPLPPVLVSGRTGAKTPPGAASHSSVVSVGRWTLSSLGSTTSVRTCIFPWKFLSFFPCLHCILWHSPFLWS